MRAVHCCQQMAGSCSEASDVLRLHATGDGTGALSLVASGLRTAAQQVSSGSRRCSTAAAALALRVAAGCAAWRMTASLDPLLGMPTEQTPRCMCTRSQKHQLLPGSQTGGRSRSAYGWLTGPCLFVLVSWQACSTVAAGWGIINGLSCIWCAIADKVVAGRNAGLSPVLLQLCVHSGLHQDGWLTRGGRAHGCTDRICKQSQ